MRAPTPSQTIGPFFGFALPFADDANASVDPRHAIRVEGQVLDGMGEPVSDALVEASQGDQFARCRTDPEGAFHLFLGKPVVSGGAPFFHITVFARGLLRHLQTRMYLPDDADANRVDPALLLVDDARRQTLVARRDGEILYFDIRLQGPGETVFFSS